MSNQYEVVWRIDAECDDPLTAALEAEMMQAGQIEAGRAGVGGGVFEVYHENALVRIVDLEALRLNPDGLEEL